MADEFAIVVQDAPLATGDQDFTSSKITDYTGALVLISGDYLTEGSSAQFTVCLFTKDQGSSTSHGYVAGFSRSGATNVGLSRHFAAGVTDGAGIIRVLDPAGNGTNWGLGTVVDLSNGFRITWTDVSGFSSSRKVKLVALLFGKTPMRAGATNQNSSMMPGGNPSQMLALTKRGAFATTNNDLSLGCGGAVDGATIEQALAMVNFPTAADPITVASYGSATNYGGRINASAGVPTTVDVQACTDFTADGFLKDSSTIAGFFTSWNWIDDRIGFARLVTLTGSESGSTLLLNLGRHVEIVFAMFVGADMTDTLENTSKSEQVGLFLFDGQAEAHSIAFAVDEGLDPDSLVTVGLSRYKANEWNVVSSSGGTAFRVTSLESTEEGLRGNVVTAKAGRLFLWGVSRIAALTPTPAELELDIPSPTLLSATTQFAQSVELELEAPDVQVLFPQVPPSVELVLELPSPALFAPPLLPTPTLPPDLGPLYTETLAGLLPRGLAWPRRPLP